MKGIDVFKKKVSPEKFGKILLIACLVGTAFVAIAACFGYSVVRDQSVGKRLMKDYWETARFSLAGNPYKGPYFTSYPPIAFLPVYPFALIAKNVLSLECAAAVRTWQFALSIGSFYAVTLSLCTLLLTRLFGKITWKRLGIFAAFVFCSLPVYFMVVRGNIVVLSFLFFLLFLNGYNSDRLWIRLLSCAALAVAGGIKLYVLAFVFLLARKGRMLECLLTGGLFLIVFFLPFFLYEGNALGLWRDNMSSFLDATGQMAHANNIGIGQILLAPVSAAQLLGAELGSWFDVALTFLQLFFGVLCIFTALFEKDDLRAFAVLTALSCQVANPSYLYIGVFLLPVFLSKLKKGRLSVAEAVLFFALFVSPCYIKWIGCYVQCAMLSAWSIANIVCSLRDFVNGYTVKEVGVRTKELLLGFRYNTVKSLGDTTALRSAEKEALGFALSAPPSDGE